MRGTVMDKHSIGKTIAEMRRAKGWTQVELAQRLNISDKAVSKWESEAGFPEISMFPLIANLFGVSIDYLMTGKDLQAKIITISKAELCAKNDDVVLLKNVNYEQKDENNKCLIDYIKQYESLNVFVALCEEKKGAICSFDILTALRLCLLSNHIELLNKARFVLRPGVASYTFNSPEEIMGLLPVGALECFGKREGIDKYACILPDDFFAMIVTDKRINEKTIDFLLGRQQGRQCIWYHAFPYLIDACYEAGRVEFLERLLALSEGNNKYAFDNLKNRGDYSYNYFFIGFIGRKDGHGLVRILDKTLKAALQKSDFQLIERMNNINKDVMKYYSGFACGVVSDDEIRVAKLKLDKSVSKQEILVQSSIHKGIIVVDELLAVKDVSAIEKALEKYPVSKFEQRDAVLKKIQQTVIGDDWRYIFQYAVDHEDSLLAQYASEENKEKIEQWVLKQKKLPPFIENTVEKFFAQYDKDNPNLKYFKLRKKEKFSGIVHSHEGLRSYRGNSKSITIGTSEELTEYIKLCKKQIVQDLKENNNTDKVIKELSEEFFRKELAKDNYELVAIKLCVRLEAVLKSKFYYEGDFSEMLEKYFSQYGSYEEDDGWGYLERRTEQFVSYLQKLRKYRNSIVHCEKKIDGMTQEELDFCIQYICSLN